MLPQGAQGGIRLVSESAASRYVGAVQRRLYSRNLAKRRELETVRLLANRYARLHGDTSACVRGSFNCAHDGRELREMKECG